MQFKPTATEMADDLQGNAGNPTGMKAQLLLVAEIMRHFTDEEHGLTADEIREVIGAKTGKLPTAVKVRDDIHALARAHAFGMDVSIPSRGESSGFRCKRTFLSSEQARLVINMVRTCKFVTQEQRDNICEALYGMVSYYQQDHIARSVVVDERELPQGSGINVFAAAEAFSSALEAGKMISFKYAARGLDGTEQLSVNQAGEGVILEETPIALVLSFGNYYAETWSGSESDGRRTTRRLDRMRDTKVSNRAAVSSPTIDELQRTVQERMAQTFDMFGEGATRDLFLRVSNWSARYIYDRFGQGVRFEHIERDMSYGYVHVRIKPAQTFYRWLFGMGDQITIAKPLGPLWEEAFRKDGLDPRKSHEELVADYEAAVEGMRELLAKSANVYSMSF